MLDQLLTYMHATQTIPIQCRRVKSIVDYLVLARGVVSELIVHKILIRELTVKKISGNTCNIQYFYSVSCDFNANHDVLAKELQL